MLLYRIPSDLYLRNVRRNAKIAKVDKNKLFTFRSTQTNRARRAYRYIAMDLTSACEAQHHFAKGHSTRSRNGFRDEFVFSLYCLM